jgi:hypothetical protein
MANKHLTAIDLVKNELQNARIQNLSSAPSSPVEGLVYFDTTLHQFGCYSNSTWVYLSSGTGNAITRASNAGGDGELIVAAGADRSARAYTTAGLLKIAAGAVAAAVAGTDYTSPSSAESFTNKTYNAAGTGNVLSNIATSMFAANVVDTDGTLAANSDTRLASQKAVKTYVDAIAQGLKWKQAARLATTGAETYTISGGAVTQITGTSIDGVTGAVNDRIVIKNAPASTGAGAGAGTANTTQPANGIYIITNATTNLTVQRDTDADTATEIKGAVVDVLEGTANADGAFSMITDGTITLNTTGLTWIDFIKANVPSASTTTAGKVTLATLAEAEAKSDANKAVTPSAIANFGVKKTFTIGNGSSTTLTCTHNLNTKDVIVQVRDASTDEVVYPDIAPNNVNSVDIIFAVAPASNAYKVVVIG